ncbi:MAG: TolC family protein [Deltaproteobacteria bacterium]|nr:TolC family protein [Deltaproteobacteria bacterium]
MNLTSLLVAVLTAQPSPVETEPAPAPQAAGMTLAEAVRVALANHPDLAVANAQTAIAQARIEQTKAPLRPTLDGTATAGAQGTEPPDFFDPAVSARVSVSLGWLVTDFGRTQARQRQARLGIDSADVGVALTQQALVELVEVTWFEALARDQLITVVEASVAAEERHLGEAERLVKVGVKPSFDVAQAKTQLALARTQLARAKGDARLARARLAQAMGAEAATIDGPLAGGWPAAEPGEDEAVTTLLAEAVGQRPDARAADLSVRATELAIATAEHGLNPTLSVGAELGAQATEAGLGAGWGASVTLRWPILDGGLTDAQVDEARAERVAADKDKLALILRIRTEIAAAQEAIRSARAQREAAVASRAIAEEALRLAEARYAQGLSSGIELADALANVVLTGADSVSAEWSLASARASLRASLGRGPR